LPGKTHKALLEGIENTSGNDRMTLTLALNYSSRWEITTAGRNLASAVQAGKISVDEISEETFNTFLSTAHMPDPELLIRTSGECRISNYLLWQIAYAELYFTKIFWPDFSKEDFYQALIDYQHRERRFGKTSEQVV
jgi:undecaprenyl diphosphate synthase